jgi:hypothetical protein
MSLAGNIIRIINNEDNTEKTIPSPFYVKDMFIKTRSHAFKDICEKFF